MQKKFYMDSEKNFLRIDFRIVIFRKEQRKCAKISACGGLNWEISMFLFINFGKSPLEEAAKIFEKKKFYIHEKVKKKH